MTKPVGSKQRKPRDGKREKNHALQAFRKVKRAEKRKKSQFQEYYDSMCGPVTITYKEVNLNN
jgi:hypothetical protein